jgi:hypothetical protein
MHECNVLGSGPSRKSYIPNELPTIGCNFPWTRVNWLVFFDVQPILKYLENKKLISDDVKFIVSKHAYDYLKEQNLILEIQNKIECVYKKHNVSTIEYSGNSAHYAVEWAIYKGFKKINIYGCDNYFGDLECTENFTHNKNSEHYIENLWVNVNPKENLLKRGREWQLCWKRIIKYNSNIEFNFVR